MRDQVKYRRICMYNYYAWGVIADVQGRDIYVGGEEVQHTLMSRYLASAGYDVTSLVGDFGQQPLEQIHGVKVRKTFPLRAGLPGLRFLTPRLSRTWSAMQEADADVYYVSCAGAIVGIMAAFCQRYKRRFVFRVASDSDCQPDKLLVSNARDRMLYEYGLRRADRILTQTERQAELLKQNYGLDAEVAGMFTELPEQVAPFAARDIDLLWLANLRHMKRPEWFVDIARAAPELACVMAGGTYPGEEALYAGVERDGSALANFTFHGRVQFATTRKLFSRARIFVNTSSWEGFPNTYLQAWANGVPVVATFDPDGIIASRQLGITVPQEAGPEGVAAAARRLIASPAEWQACSERCRAYARERLAPEKVAAPYLAAMVLQ